MAALCVRTSLHWLLCTGCSNMVPHSYRAGQMSYVKLLRGRREEPGNEASASSLFVFVVCFLFFGLYIKLGMHTSTSFYITIHLQKCSSVMFIPQHYLHALTVFPILVIYNIRINITLYICSILIMHSFGGLLYNYHCSHVCTSVYISSTAAYATAAGWPPGSGAETSWLIIFASVVLPACNSSLPGRASRRTTSNTSPSKTMYV